uniref:Retrotransposon gag domain-containing protein n=1 Tax=Tanacetum cinerariifolium TaxID=118510 RepID=A0A699J953_TANCI|nr:hypothetical protein [Tanacetum cinerariifolium]
MFHQTLGGAIRNWFDDLDPKSVDSFEELSQKFLEEFSQQKRYAKTLQKFTGLRGDKMRACKLSWIGHGHPELAKKLNDKIPKTVDKMFEKVRAFIRGEVPVRSAKMVCPSQGDKGDKGHNTNDCYQFKKQIEEVVASRKLAHLVKDIRQNNQHRGNQGRNYVKIINIIREGGNHKRHFEEGRSSLTDELTFPAIPRN